MPTEFGAVDQVGVGLLFDWIFFSWVFKVGECNEVQKIKACFGQYTVGKNFFLIKFSNSQFSSQRIDRNFKGELIEQFPKHLY